MTYNVRRKNICRVEGCQRTNYGTICSMHRERLRATGSVGTVEARHELPANHYRSAHARVERRRGKASQFPCVDCDQPAREWSYRGGADNEQYEYLNANTPWREGEIAFSSNPDDYDPRCKPCHIKYDQRQAS